MNGFAQDRPPRAEPVPRPRRGLSLAGKLFLLAAGFVMLAEVLIYLPSAANFRESWLTDRANSAHLAAIAAESADDDGLGDELVQELLTGAQAVAVARIVDGATELVLGGDVGDAPTVNAELDTEGPLARLAAVPRTLFAPPGRFVVVTATPETRPGERIIVVVPEGPLRAALIDYSVRIFWLSIFISATTGALIYLSLLFLLIRPMKRLSQAMTAFQQDPSDARRALPVSERRDELGQAQIALSDMQADVLAALKQRERLAALGAAVAKINHDLRNILSSAQLVSDRLATSEDDRVAAQGQRLVRAIGRGVALCQRVLDYGRAEEPAPQMADVPLRECAEAAARDALAGRADVNWVNALDAGLVARADPDNLHRIFENLFRNAAEAMTGGERRALGVTAEAAGGALAVRVSDTGPGIPDQVKKTLFTPFGRSGKPEGSGLGLSIARDLARAMDGDVTLIETGDRGTVFEVRLKGA